MKRAGVLLFLPACLACSGDSLEDEPVFAAACVVDRVADGDTVTCIDGTRIRLIGIDAPELDQPPYGEQSRVALEGVLPPGRAAQLELDVETRDDFGRTLAYLWDGNSMVNETMIRDGWAVAFIIPPNVRYADRFRDAEEDAMRAGAGHWATGGFACLPFDHRQGTC